MRIELQSVNTNKLHDELIEAGIIPQLVESLNNTTWVTIEDSQYDATMAVVAAHNPTPLSQPPTEEERLKSVEDAVTTLMGV